MATSIDYIELRKTARSLRQTPISCRSLVAPVNGDGPITVSGTLTDLTAGGAGLLVGYPFRLNETLRIDGIDDDQPSRDGRVCWVRKTNAHYRIGVAFS